jgi:hypothetical protein
MSRSTTTFSELKDGWSHRMRLRLRRWVSVEPGEMRALFWSFAYFFALLCSYYIIRPIRDEMGIAGGIDKLQWMFSGTFLVMLAAVPLFGWVAKRFPVRRYIGITTSHGRSHAELMQIMRTEDLDFVQFTYNIGNRTVEDSLLPLAADRGMATLINLPFQRGDLFRKVKGKALPEWVLEFDCQSWGQFFLKFIVSHPAVTCVIPATSKVHHMTDNMAVNFGKLPTPSMRKRMLQYFTSL